MRVQGPPGTQARLGVVSFTVDGVHPHDVCQMLDEFGVCLRGGHHCAQPLMDALDLPATARASLAPYNDAADVDALLVRPRAGDPAAGPGEAMTTELYNEAILAEAKAGHGSGTLPTPDVSVTCDNPLCGDRVAVDLNVTGRGSMPSRTARAAAC